MSHREWRFGIIGVGVVGEWHVRVIPRVPGAKLVAVCDLDAPKAEAALKKNQVDAKIYTDMKQMLVQERLDVVTIATPSGFHMEPALLAIEAGKNVICEKPMEIELSKIDRMVAAAKSKGVRLAGIFQNRWNEANRVVRDAVASGRFGRLAWAGSFTPWYRTDKYYEEGGWRGTWAMDGGGAIMNQSVHAVDLLQWIVGPVKQVSAYASSRIHPKIEVEDTLSASLLFENGAFGTIMGTTAMFPGGGVRIWVGGEHGTAVSENGLHTFSFRNDPADPARAAADKELIEKLNTKKATSTAGGASATDVPTELHRRNVDAILRDWEAGQDAETHGPEARKAVAIILAMYESARNNGAPVAVK